MDPKVAKADAKHAKIHSEKRRKDSSERKTGNEVFDKITLETLYKLANQGYIDVLNGAISTGKEANVLTGITDDEKFVAVKIYRIATSNAGVRVPKPITSANNVLLIEFIGDEDGNPAQPVRNQPPQDPNEFWNLLLVDLKRFVNDAKLVHGDLSNYNLLNLDEKPVIIDVSQSVVLDNPISKELLERDINTLVREYTKLGVKTSFEEVWEYVNPKF